MYLLVRLDYIPPCDNVRSEGLGGQVSLDQYITHTTSSHPQSLTQVYTYTHKVDFISEFIIRIMTLGS